MTDAPRYDWSDPYHTLLAIGWPPFLLGVLLYFLAVNALFGTLYAWRPGCVANLPPGRWDDAFFFSVETFGTVGYGVMAPQTLYGHLVATAEVFLGILSSALLTGLIFVRFARPRARMQFSRQATIAPHDGVPTLAVRVANRHVGSIYDATASLTLIRRHQTIEGQITWPGFELALTRGRLPVFTLTWTLRHPIDSGSPLHGLTTADLIAQDAQFVVTVTGIDSVLAAPVRAGRVYEPGDLLWGFRFADMLTVDARGRTHVVVARLHDVQPA